MIAGGMIAGDLLLESCNYPAQAGTLTSAGSAELEIGGLKASRGSGSARTGKVRRSQWGLVARGGSCCTGTALNNGLAGRH